MVICSWEVQIRWWQVNRRGINAFITFHAALALYQLMNSSFPRSLKIVTYCTSLLRCTLGMTRGQGGTSSWHDPLRALCLHSAFSAQWLMPSALRNTQQHWEVFQGRQQQGELCLLGCAVCLSEEASRWWSCECISITDPPTSTKQKEVSCIKEYHWTTHETYLDLSVFDEGFPVFSWEEEPDPHWLTRSLPHHMKIRISQLWSTYLTVSTAQCGTSFCLAEPHRNLWTQGPLACCRTPSWSRSYKVTRCLSKHGNNRKCHWDVECLQSTYGPGTAHCCHFRRTEKVN